MPLLKRYWIEFEMDINSEADIQRYGYLPAGPGIGVTAYDYGDALKLLRRYVAKDGRELPKVRRLIEGVDISELFPPGTPLPMDIGCPVWRGLWFPPFTLWFGPDFKP